MAEQVKKTLNERGLTEVLYRGFAPGRTDYAPEVDALQAADAGVLFIGGYLTEIALIAREAYDRSYPVHLVTSGTLATEELGLIPGPASDGVLFLDVADPRQALPRPLQPAPRRQGGTAREFHHLRGRQLVPRVPSRWCRSSRTPLACGGGGNIGGQDMRANARPFPHLKTDKRMVGCEGDRSPLSLRGRRLGGPHGGRL